MMVKFKKYFKSGLIFIFLLIELNELRNCCTRLQVEKTETEADFQLEITELKESNQKLLSQLNFCSNELQESRKIIKVAQNQKLSLEQELEALSKVAKETDSLVNALQLEIRKHEQESKTFQEKLELLKKHISLAEKNFDIISRRSDETINKLKSEVEESRMNFSASRKGVLFT